MKRIIYQSGTGVAIIIPADCGLTIEEIAVKDVPTGVPYKIIDTADIPDNRSQRHLWQDNFSNPDGCGG